MCFSLASFPQALATDAGGSSMVGYIARLLGMGNSCCSFQEGETTWFKWRQLIGDRGSIQDSVLSDVKEEGKDDVNT